MMARSRLQSSWQSFPWVWGMAHRAHSNQQYSRACLHLQDRLHLTACRPASARRQVGLLPGHAGHGPVHVRHPGADHHAPAGGRRHGVDHALAHRHAPGHRNGRQLRCAAGAPGPACAAPASAPTTLDAEISLEPQGPGSGPSTLTDHCVGACLRPVAPARVPLVVVDSAYMHRSQPLRCELFAGLYTSGVIWHLGHCSR